jgi:hypothetical protein
MLLMPCGTICATVLIETISAAFEMQEIIYKLRWGWQHARRLDDNLLLWLQTCCALPRGIIRTTMLGLVVFM